MGFPTITARISFTDPLAIPVWTDVSTYLRNTPIAIRRGRQMELDRIEAGTLQFALNNQDRRFEPGYAGGAYAPNIRPALRVNIRATWASVTYDLFTGFIEAWSPRWSGYESWVEVRAVDAFKYLALVPLALSRGAEYSGDRVTAVLNALGWPAGDRSINGGQSLVMLLDSVATPIAALGHLQALAATENGLLFISGAGGVVWQGRHYRILNNTTPAVTLGSDALAYESDDPLLSDDLIYNVVTLGNTDGSTATAFSQGSKDTYFPRQYSRSGLLLQTPGNELQNAANWTVQRYSLPDLRFRSVTLNGNLTDTAWSHMLGRELSERVRVNYRPPGVATAQVRDCYIEGVNHQIGRATWQTSWQLSPAASLASYWVLGSATQSVLGTTTMPAY